MATPTDQQQIRATLRRRAKAEGDDEAARLAVVEAASLLGFQVVLEAVRYRLSIENMVSPGWMDGELPALMGTAEVAAAFGIANSNIAKLADPPLPVARISGGKVPVYLESEVMAKVEARNAARGRA